MWNNLSKEQQVGSKDEQNNDSGYRSTKAKIREMDDGEEDEAVQK